MKRFTLCILAAMLISGCSFIEKKTNVSSINGIRVVSMTSDLNSAYMKDHGSIEFLCAERPGDVADTASLGVGLDVGTGLTTEGGGESMSQGALSLGGRDPAVLITRELMYRACELVMSLNLDKEEALKVYYHFLEASIQIARQQTGPGVASVAAQSNAPNLSPFQKPATPASTSGDSDSSDDSDTDTGSDTK